MKHMHALGACGAVSVLLTACAAGQSPSTGSVTVTVTPTVTARGTSSAKPAAPAPPSSDDTGRTYDFGTVVTARTVAGAVALELDRWTWKKLDDAKLARNGVPLTAFKGPVPYENQNARLTYTLPVVDGARILYHHCLAADQPLQTKSVTPQDLAALAGRENTVLVRLDARGRVIAADNIPGCPS